MQNAVQFLDALIKDIAADCTHWDVAAFIPKVHSCGKYKAAQGKRKREFGRWRMGRSKGRKGRSARGTWHVARVGMCLHTRCPLQPACNETLRPHTPYVSPHPQLRDYLRVTNPHKRQFLLSWVVVLDSLPHVHMLRHLPALLDGLLSMLAEPVREVRTQAANCLKVRLSARR